MALLARSLLAHGKSREAKLWQGRAEAAAAGKDAANPDVAHTRVLLRAGGHPRRSRPRNPLGTRRRLGPAGHPAGPGARHRDPRARGVRGHHRPGRQEQVRQRLQDRRGLARTNLGRKARQGLFLAHRIPRLQGGVLRRCHRRIEPLADDAEFAKRRPELLYYLGRSYFANANCAKAVAALERYIVAQEALGRPVLPASAKARTKRKSHKPPRRWYHEAVARKRIARKPPAFRGKARAKMTGQARCKKTPERAPAAAAWWSASAWPPSICFSFPRASTSAWSTPRSSACRPAARPRTCSPPWP